VAGSHPELGHCFLPVLPHDAAWELAAEVEEQDSALVRFAVPQCHNLSGMDAGWADERRNSMSHDHFQCPVSRRHGQEWARSSGHHSLVRGT
jgi:hypothetical protein